MDKGLGFVDVLKKSLFCNTGHMSESHSWKDRILEIWLHYSPHIGVTEG